MKLIANRINQTHLRDILPVISEAVQVDNVLAAIAYGSSASDKKNIPLNRGPYADFAKKLAILQERLPHRVEHSPVRIALVTARNSPSELRPILTLRDWGIYVDEAFFMGGLDKTKVLEAFNPHIFFDDQPRHIRSASDAVLSARVPYKSDSPLAAPSSINIEKIPETEA